jgi:hypothetical protein
MKVVEKDKLVHGMLQEELARCRSMVSSLERKLSELPKGSLHIRQKSASPGRPQTIRVYKAAQVSGRSLRPTTVQEKSHVRPGSASAHEGHKSISPSLKDRGSKEVRKEVGSASRIHEEPGRYSYHYLKYRERGKSISKHIPKDQVEELLGRLEARKNYERELDTIRGRIRYLEKILRVGEK